MFTTPGCESFEASANVSSSSRGWEPPPPELGASDLHLWRSFLGEPWCRATTALVPTGICTQTHLRPHLPEAERAAELARLAELSQQPVWVARLRRLVSWRLVARLFSRRAENLPAFGWPRPPLRDSAPFRARIR